MGSDYGPRPEGRVDFRGLGGLAPQVLSGQRGVRCAAGPLVQNGVGTARPRPTGRRRTCGLYRAATGASTSPTGCPDQSGFVSGMQARRPHWCRDGVPRSRACFARPAPARSRGAARAGDLSRPVRGLLGAADHRTDDAWGAAQPADIDPERLGHARPAVARPGVPAGGHRVRRRPRPAGALPAEPDRPAGHPPDRLRLDPPRLRRLVRRGDHRLHRHPRPRPLPGRQGARDQHPGAGVRAHRPVVDHPGADPRRRPERRPGGGGDGRLPVHPARPAALARARRS